MSIKVILFDLDGTLLPLDPKAFEKAYFGMLASKLSSRGYETEQLVKAIWSGTVAMVDNNGKKTNEAVFWDRFSEIYGDKAREDMPYFDEYYRTDFDKVKISCGYTPQADAAIKELKSLGYKVVLATNPLFPSIATEKRAAWAGLDIKDFELFTTYENSHYCKPNPAYYLEIVDKLGVLPTECMMVGNDVEEDMIAQSLGMKVFLITDCLINKKEKDISVYPHGDIDALVCYIKNNFCF